MKKPAFLLLLLAAACTTPTPIATPLPTLTLTQTITLPPTATASLPQASPTVTPLLIEGSLTIKVNVRSGPATTYSSLGQLDAGQQVQVLFRDATGAWYLILYPPAPQGQGWIASRYVTIGAGTQVPLNATPTPTGPTGLVILRLNVRSGPGMNFNTLGMLDPNQVVAITGKNSTASWFQINYSTGPGGHGWVTAQYVQTDASASLPVLDDYGNVVTPGATAESSAPAITQTPTIGPALADGDSSSNPAVRVTFSSNGTNRFIFSDKVSAPQGDPEDWIEFIPYSTSGTTARMKFSLTCSGNSTLTVELWKQGTVLSGWGSLACGDTGISILLIPSQVYQLRLAPSGGSGLQFISYTLDIQNNP